MIKHTIYAYITEYNERPGKDYTFLENQHHRNRLHVFSKQTDDYRLNIIVKSDIGRIVGTKVTEPRYMISIETSLANYFIHFWETVNTSNYTVDFSNPNESEALSDLLEILDSLNLTK